MNEVNQLIASYLNARAAVLRVVEDKKLKASGLSKDLPLSCNVLRRKLKTSDWRADELTQLAKITGLSVELEIYLKLLNERLQTLPENDWKQLVRETHIGQQRIQSLMNDYCIWQHAELYQVSNFLNKYVSTTT